MITNPAGSGNTITVTISFPETAAPGEHTVSALDLTALVAAPAKDETPVMTINTSQYAGTITWQPADSPFAPSTAYQAEVILTATTGYTFAGLGANSFSHSGAATITNTVGSDTITVTISFPATAATGENTVNALDLTALVIAPVNGAMPVTAITAPQYMGTITWNPAHSLFAPSMAYQAAVVLTATTGYTFAGVSAGSFTYTGASVTNPAGSGNIITVMISFPATAADVVSDLDLTMLVTAPVKYEAPNITAINAAQYTGNISWQTADSTFAPSTVYQAEVVLLAKSGFTFTGVNADSFNHTTYTGTMATNLAGNGNTITVTITFPATADPEYAITVDPDAGDGAFSQASFTISGTATQTVTVVAGSGYANPRWFVDGDLKGTTDTITIDAADYSDSPGVHNLTLLITKSGVSWSKEITFTVN
jgi:hypothetical protein